MGRNRQVGWACLIIFFGTRSATSKFARIAQIAKRIAPVIVDWRNTLRYSAYGLSRVAASDDRFSRMTVEPTTMTTIKVQQGAVARSDQSGAKSL